MSAVVVAAAMAMPGPSAQAWAQSNKPTRSTLDKRDLLNPPARGNGFLVGGASLVAFVGAPSIAMTVIFSRLRRAAYALGEEIEIPENSNIPLPEDLPDNEEIQEIREDVDQRLRRVTNYFIVSSVVGFVGGATLLALGARRRIRFRHWRRVQRRSLRRTIGRHQVSPVFSRSDRSTLTYGIAARF